MTKARGIIRTLGSSLLLLALLFSVAKLGAEAEGPERPSFRLTIIDGDTGDPTPARVEVLDETGTGYVAEDALVVGGDSKDRLVPWEGTAEEALGELVPSIRHPYSRTIQFYSTGNSQLFLPPGKYDLKVMKGFEYRVERRQLEVPAGENLQETVELSRWANLSDQGWYSADNHLHIARPHRELDPHLLKWMKAEDVQVASLLQWGHSKVSHNTLQYSFGPKGAYQEGTYILASGQENPRTHVLGHTIILGASCPIDFPDRYIIYKLFWEEAVRQGALNGYAHFGVAAGGINGLSIDLPFNMINFLEVLQFASGDYHVWYNILNTGFRMTPTGGSDYPFGGLPGIERFYTKIDGPFSYESWMEGIKQGRTFVTNGPLLDFRVDEQEVGSELVLEEPGKVEVEARVRFDSTRDNIDRLDIVQNGRVTRSFQREPGSAQINCRFDLEVREAGWIAARASGNKTGEIRRINSLAHSAPVYLSVKNVPGRSEHPRAKVMARAWLARLDELQRRLFSQVDSMGLSRWPDGVDASQMRKNRKELLEAIKTAKEYFLEQAG